MAKRGALGPGDPRNPLAELHRFHAFRSLLGAYGAAKLYAAWLGRREEVSLRIPGITYPVVCRVFEPDRFTLFHIFGIGECEIPVDLEPQLIVDGGANTGLAAVYYANRYPSARIIALEPDPENARIARKNIAPYPQIELLEAALWPRDTTVVIENPDERSWGFRVSEAAAGVPGISPQTLIAEYGTIDVLKLDIEGGEIPLLQNGSRDWLFDTTVAVIETHGVESEEVVAQAMADAGFQLVREELRRVYVAASSPDSHPPSEQWLSRPFSASPGRS